jgi:hypothetical protein
MEDIRPIKLIVTQQEKSNIPLDNRQTGNSLAGSAGNLSNGIAYYSLIHYFDLGSDETLDKKNTEQLELVYNWAKMKTKSDSIQDIIRIVRHIENRIGIPQIGVSRFNHVYNYIKIDSTINEMEQERNRMEGLNV